ncbi:Alcohol dehydrogenase GroES domain protein [Paraburkholderia ribeironis]|uniref:Alcohol dehydrogenase GroES domain protein n=1 Tax=Paraburkholderia ribeironis TaxID=1247936 RepID=A0A1N7SB59_9BURK|nr:zinc-binding dehydrogenase [Paraburkholderia ribeironis]SIT44639.1 Alcohol dehydrogenase GroES domain protein [Paraburkholderia ribeironis]
MTVPNTMRVMRVHEPAGRFVLDEIARPTLLRPTDVLVDVKASGVVPNLRNVMSNYGDRAYLTVPDLPAIYGLDAAGVVAEVGSAVTGVAVGDRVYINPGRSCGSCQACRIGEPINCEAFTFQGYFGFGPKSKRIYEQYPYGGFSEFASAPADGLVKLPDAVSFEQAARFGYLGTAYSGLRKAGVGAGRTVLISGATGTLGLGAVQIARAMGATRILCVARNEALLARVRALDPQRIRTFSYGSGSLADWAHAQTDGLGVDAVIDAIGPGASHQVTLDCISSLRRGGKLVEVGAMSDPLPLNLHELMCAQVSVLGSLWFSVAEGQDLAEMAAGGTLDLSVFEHHHYTLEQANEALADAEKRAGGFVNVVILQ